MKTGIHVIKWLFYAAFLSILAVFWARYIRWFQLTPLILLRYNDPDYACGIGLIFLVLGSIMVSLSWFVKKYGFIFVFFAFLALFVSETLRYQYFPELDTHTKCNGSDYYITYNHPFLDYQWSYYQVTIWRGFLHYDSQFFGYAPGAGPFDIVCDEENHETNFIEIKGNNLVYSDGHDPRYYDEYAGCQLGDHLYFLSRICNNWEPDTCESMTYTLYRCDLDYRSCEPLPIRYTADTDEPFLESHEDTNEVYLYDGWDEDAILVFIYGERPSCLVEGCEIVE